MNTPHWRGARLRKPALATLSVAALAPAVAPAEAQTPAPAPPPIHLKTSHHVLSGKNVKVQWILGASGFGCGTSPYGTPSPDFPDPVAKYPLTKFRGKKRIVRLPIKFDFKDVHGSFDAHVTYDGIARLRRYR